MSDCNVNKNRESVVTKGNILWVCAMTAIIHDYYIAGVLVGIVSGLAVLLLISVSINVLAAIYKLRGKLTQCVSGGGGRENVEQVDEQGHYEDIVAIKQNVNYQLHTYRKN